MIGASGEAQLVKDVKQAFDLFPPERARAYASALTANLLAVGPPDRTRLRRLVHLRRLVNAAEPGSAVDLLDAYALPLPTALICDLLLLAADQE
jgi:hypothetical protein